MYIGMCVFLNGNLHAGYNMDIIAKVELLPVNNMLIIASHTQCLNIFRDVFAAAFFGAHCLHKNKGCLLEQQAEPQQLCSIHFGAQLCTSIGGIHLFNNRYANKCIINKNSQKLQQKNSTSIALCAEFFYNAIEYH